jgi:uncharacterized protein with PQ loop repeat
MLSTALGLLAASWAVVMALGPVLQIREILRRRSSAGLSLGYLAVLLVVFALWVAYGVASDDLPLVVPNTLAFLVMCVTIGAVVRFGRAMSQRCGVPGMSRVGTSPSPQILVR